MSAAGALIEVSAECGGAAARNGQQHFQMLPGEPLTASFDECISRCADDIGHLQRRPVHLLVLRWTRLVSFSESRGLAVARRCVRRDAGRWWSPPDRDVQAESEWCADRRHLPADAWRNSAARCGGAPSFGCRLVWRLAGKRARPPWCRSVVAGVPAVAGKQPGAGLAPEAAPVLAQCFEQFGAEHDVAIFASLAALDVDHHALAIDVADFQVSQFGAAHSGGVEGHQQSAMKGVSAESMSRATSSWLRIEGR